jgi:hypothetical protein
MDTTALTPAKTPEIGEFATYRIGSDRYAVEIIEVKRNARTLVTRDAAVVMAGGAYPGDHEWGGTEMGTYVVLSDEAGSLHEFTLRGDGSYRSKGSNYGSLALGVVSPYRDPSF